MISTMYGLLEATKTGKSAAHTFCPTHCCCFLIAPALAGKEFPSLGGLSCFFHGLGGQMGPYSGVKSVCLLRASSVPWSWAGMKSDCENNTLCLTTWIIFFNRYNWFKCFKYHMTPKLMLCAIADPALWHLFHCNHCCSMPSLHRILATSNKK